MQNDYAAIEFFIKLVAIILLMRVINLDKILKWKTASRFPKGTIHHPDRAQYKDPKTGKWRNYFE